MPERLRDAARRRNILENNSLARSCARIADRWETPSAFGGTKAEKISTKAQRDLFPLLIIPINLIENVYKECA
jgi:hypothetical protein